MCDEECNYGGKGYYCEYEAGRDFAVCCFLAVVEDFEGFFVIAAAFVYSAESFVNDVFSGVHVVQFCVLER